MLRVFSQGPSVDGIEAHFLSQIDALIGKAAISDQNAADAIQQQATQVAGLFSDFAGQATETLDVCIYDFRLTIPEVSAIVVKAINNAAERGVAVRVAYDKTQNDGDILKQFSGAGGDPAPTGTHRFLASAPLHPAVQLKAVLEESIDPASQIMHNKYMVADAKTPDARVWMGSANFTVDAWALQENNLLLVASPELASAYVKDFDDLWTAGRLNATGAGDTGSVIIHGTQVEYAFAPGEGKTVEQMVASTVAAAKKRIRIASMVTSSPAILLALKAAIDAGIDLDGVYDYGESHGVVTGYRHRAADPKTKDPAADTAKADLIESVLDQLVGKHSLPITKEHPDWAHNLMHDKILVADDVVVTGSFNFSTNATRNAENVLRISHPGLAAAYADYVDGLVERYKVA